MSAPSCEVWPKVGGKDSLMYKDLIQKHKLDRPLANYIYSEYETSNAANLMDAVLLPNGKPKYRRNSQGQHRAKDVLEFIDFGARQEEIMGIKATERSLGIVDSSNNRVNFADAKYALEKADNYNNRAKGTVARVVQHGDYYNIILMEKDANTLDEVTKTKQKLEVWDLYKQAFNAVGVDIEALPAELRTVFNAFNTVPGLGTVDIQNYLQDLKTRGFSTLDREKALSLFSLTPATSPYIQRVIRLYGSLENAAQAIDDYNAHLAALNPYAERVLRNAITDCQRLNGIDLAALKTQVDQKIRDVRTNSPEEPIRNEIDTLHRAYDINRRELTRLNNKIKTLTDAAADAVILLKRQIAELERAVGKNALGKQKEYIYYRLLNALENKKYYSGIMEFLNDAVNVQPQIDNILTSVPTTGSKTTIAMAHAKALFQVNSLINQYYNIVEALASKTITIDDALTATEIDDIRQAAKSLKEFLDNRRVQIAEEGEQVMFQLMSANVGVNTPEGQMLMHAIKAANADSNIYDYLYSIGRATNPMVAAMGAIIRKAQDTRDAKMKDFRLRIARATDALKKNGGNSSFMYGADGFIISEYDWVKYYKDRSKYKNSLKMRGYHGFALKAEMEQWEDDHTVDKVVDTTNGRTEKVPDSRYRKPFPHLTAAQQTYYDTMMQIKGEIGSMLPAYAQQQYVPPQVRRSFFDALFAGDIKSAFKNKIENLWKIREDDTDYAKNGYISSDGSQIVDSDYDNTELKQIPVFYINKIKDQRELLRNFSTGLQHLAGTAINYQAMSEVADTVEFMGDFITSKAVTQGKDKRDIAENRAIKVFKEVIGKGRSTHTVSIVRGAIDQQIYGQKLNPNQYGYKWSKLITNLIGYTSFKNLSTNIKGAFSNVVVAEYQMLIEAGCGEFYGYKNYLRAHAKLFGSGGAPGEIAELLTNNMSHKATLIRELFDPLDDNFSRKSHEKYYDSMLRQLLAVDLSFVGYSSGEWLVHYVNMYAVLDNIKVKVGGKVVSLDEAFEVINKVDGNAELKLKAGATMLDGSAITAEWLTDVRNKIRYVNQNTHGAMNEEDKGILNQYLMGRAALNLRQWMVEHYSRRFRAMHYDYTLRQNREGYWRSMGKLLKSGLISEELIELYKDEDSGALDVMGQFMKDLTTIYTRSAAQWHNFDEHQRYNVKRALTEFLMFIATIGLSCYLGEPDEHKKEYFRRWWIYQVRRLLLDEGASIPISPKMPKNFVGILQSPIASVDTLNSLLYCIIGLYNGDLFETIKSGPHEGENRYWRGVKRNALPFIKDIEQMKDFGESDALFKIFRDSPNRY
jgi:hypothetical protein